MTETAEIPYDTRHGGPFDRGTADSYYGREYNPHYFVGGTYMSERVGFVDMTVAQINEYACGYAYNEQYGNKKEW